MAWSLCLEFRKRKRFRPWNKSRSKNWNTSYAETPQDFVMLEFRNNFPIWSSFKALENWFWVFSFLSFWYIISSAPFPLSIYLWWTYYIKDQVLFLCQGTNYFKILVENQLLCQFYWWESWVINKKHHYL